MASYRYPAWHQRKNYYRADEIISKSSYRHSHVDKMVSLYWNGCQRNIKVSKAPYIWFAFCCVLLRFGTGYFTHCSDVIMDAMASQITSFTIVYSTVYSCADQRNHQSSASLALCEGNSPLTGEFPSQRASNVSIWWRHRVLGLLHCHGWHSHNKNSTTSYFMG